MVVRNVHTNYLNFLIPNIQEEGGWWGIGDARGESQEKVTG